MQAVKDAATDGPAMQAVVDAATDAVKSAPPWMPGPAASSGRSLWACLWRQPLALPLALPGDTSSLCFNLSVTSPAA